MERDRQPGAGVAQRTSGAGARAGGVHRADVTRAPGPPHVDAALALQRSAGNRVTALAVRGGPVPVLDPGRTATASVQRRVPDVAVVAGIVGGGTPAVRSERKLKRVLAREIDRMEVRVTGTRLLVANQLAAAVPGAVLANVLDPAVPLGANRAQLADVIGAITAVQAAAGGAASQVRYPGPGVVNGPLTRAQQDVLDRLVVDATRIMLELSTGAHAPVMAGVFGGQVGAARALFGEAAAALARLHQTADGISVDNRGDQAAVSAAGLTGVNHMALSPHVLSAVTTANTITLVHESTHATPTGTSDDFYVDLSPNSPVLTAPEPRKVRLAPHYEEAARVALGVRPLPAFAPGAVPAAAAGAPSANLVKARAAAEQIVIRAWTVAINSHDALRAWANEQAAGTWNAWSPAERANRDRQLRTASRNLGLLMHHQPAVAGQVVGIGDLDLAIAQDRAAQIARMVQKAKDITAGDYRTGVFNWDSVGHITGNILSILVTVHGPIRKDDATSVAMLRGLASTYDNRRFLDVCARLFV